MKFLLRLAGWATALFVVAWFVAAPYEKRIAAIAGALAAPRGATIEWVELELFFPHDLAVFVAMCAASSWASWRRRGRAMAIGLPWLVAAEVVALTLAMKAMLSAAAPGVPADRLAEVQRFALGIIRVTGLIAAAAAWAFLLGREALGLAVAAFPAAPARPRSRRKP
jgi:hypothetical protein